MSGRKVPGVRFGIFAVRIVLDAGLANSLVCIVLGLLRSLHG